MRVQKEQLFIDFNTVDWEYPAEGIRRKIMAYGDQLMAVYVEFKKGAVGALHRHSHMQISYIQSGSFDVTIAGTTIRQKGGIVITFRPTLNMELWHWRRVLLSIFLHH